MSDDRPTFLSGSKPPSWVTAGMLFIASVAGGGGTGFLTTSFKVEALEHELAEHKQSEGHAASLARLRNLEERVAVQARDSEHLGQLLQSIDNRLERIENAVTATPDRPRRR